MVSKKVTVNLKQGLHMRPASVFVNQMATFASEITITVSDKTLNAKSIMNVLGAGIKFGTEIVISANGSDEQTALDTAVDFVMTEFE
ncbi:MAG: HPr family phosphocarrier protein [Clostridiales bacterium]|jgi:phosphotransferase system HPr (HPr) family protein|nr:HPr family phosphocarrier protein [Clostridiales bacterium]